MAPMNPQAGGEVPVARRPREAERPEWSEPITPAGQPAEKGSLSIVVAGAPSLLRDCLVSVLERQADVQVVGVAASVDEAQTAVTGARPDVVVLDPRLAEGDGLVLIGRLRAQGSGTRVMVLSDDQSPQMLQRAFRAGADSFMCPWCTGEDIIDAVRRTAAGQTVVAPPLVAQLVAAVATSTPAAVELSAREQEVLEHISRGATNAEIARQLHVSIRTVQKHLENLFRQLGVHERAALVAEAFRRGLLS